MPLERINPDGLAAPQTYTHVIVATGGRMVFVAGQVAEDERGELVGPGDLAAQARQAFANLGRALAAAGARPDQVAKPVDALIGVSALAHPGCLIEVEAIAVA